MSQPDWFVEPRACICTPFELAPSISESGNLPCRESCISSAGLQVVSYPTRWSFSFIPGPLHWSSIFLTSRGKRNIVQLCTSLQDAWNFLFRSSFSMCPLHKTQVQSWCIEPVCWQTPLHFGYQFLIPWISCHFLLIDKVQGPTEGEGHLPNFVGYSFSLAMSSEKQSWPSKIVALNLSQTVTLFISGIAFPRRRPW